MRARRSIGATAPVLIGFFAWALLVLPHPVDADAADVVVTDWASLRSAFAGAADGDVVRLAAGSAITNAAGENLTVPVGVSVTLDLNDSSLTISMVNQATMAGINVPSGSALTIDDSGSAGVLVARGGLTTVSNGGAGIGATGATDSVGTVTILAGTVEAYGGYQAAGIGGANYPGGVVEIDGGDVTAVGGSCASGIGGGWSGSGGSVTITGGHLSAAGSTAIGRGCANNNDGTLTLGGTPFGAPVATAGTNGATITPGTDDGRRYRATIAGPSFEVTYGQVLSFDAGAGSAVGDEFVTAGAAPSLPADPNLDHYDFTGWFTNASGGTGFDFSTPLSADETAYAHWLKHSFPVSFVMGGHGAPVAGQIVGYGELAAAPAAPSESGWVFEGWYADAGLTTGFDFSSAITAPTTVYAGWSQLPLPPPPPPPPPVPSPTPTESASPTPTPTVSPSPSDQPTPTESASPTAEPSPTDSSSPTAESSPTDSSSPTDEPSPSESGSAPGSPTASPSPSDDASPETVVAVATPSPGSTPATTTPEPAEPGPSAGSPAIVAVAAPAATRGPDLDPATTVRSPSFLTGSIRELDDVLGDPRSVAQAAAYATVWILALVCMVRLLGKTLSRRYQVWSAKVAARAPGLVTALAAASRWWRTHPRTAIGLVLGATTMISVALQPGFTLSAFGARLMCSLLLAQVAITLLSRYLAAWWAGRVWGYPIAVKPAGWSVVIALAGLGVSKALHFVPGLLQGGATDVDMGGRPVPAAIYAKAEQLRVWLSWSVAMVAWVVVSGLPAPTTVGGLTLHDALVATAVAGLGGLLVELIPLPALIGSSLRRHLPRQWVAATAATTVSFLVIVVPQASNWIEVASLGGWITVVILFTILAVTVIVAVNRRVQHELAEEVGRP